MCIPQFITNFWNQSNINKSESESAQLSKILLRETYARSKIAQCKAWTASKLNNIINLLVICGCSASAILSAIAGVSNSDPYIVQIVSYTAFAVTATVGFIKVIKLSCHLDQTALAYENIYISLNKQKRKLLNIEYQPMSDTDKSKAILDILNDTDDLIISMFNVGLNEVTITSDNTQPTQIINTMDDTV